MRSSVTRHRLINDGALPIPMGATAEYACVCGRRGTRAAIERHVAESETVREPRGVVVERRDDFGGDTQAHYVPLPPREPAPSTFSDADTNVFHLSPPPEREDLCPICQAGDVVADLPEIAAWSCGHWIRKMPRPIAEAFQDMLRLAYQAGVAAATSGEIFESWYQREVLQ